MAGGKIFICYRRDDSSGEAGRLFDRLDRRFPGRVFMDVAGISIATRWAEEIESSLRQCQVIVVLIGRRWLDAGPDGVRRIDRADDPIRREIGTALRLGLRVVPLAVSGAALPAGHQLPTDLAPMMDWQAHRIDHDDFEHDTARLIRALQSVLGEAPGDEDRRDESPATTARGVVGAVPERQKKVGGFGFTFGWLKVWVSVGIAMVAFIVVGVGGMLNTWLRPPTPPVREATAPAAAPGPVGSGGVAPTAGSPGAPEALASEAPQRVGRPARRPSSTPGVEPSPRQSTAGRGDRAQSAGGSVGGSIAPLSADSLQGMYLLTSYSFNGVRLPLTGNIQLSGVQPGLYQFDMRVADGAGSVVFYQGTLVGRGSGWTMNILNTNDPAAVLTPIPTEIVVDRDSLRVRNSLGQAAIWKRQS